MENILIAAAQESSQVVMNALKGRYNLICCDSLADARSGLASGVELVVCGLHFDEGRMLDLLRYAKADPGTRATPFICMKTIEDMLSQAIIQSIEVASRALGAEKFVDFHEWKARLGDEQAEARLRRCIDRLIQDAAAP